MLKSLKIQSKLLFISSVVILIGVLIAAWGMATVLRVDAILQDLAEVDRESSDALQVGNRFTEIAAANLGWALTGDARFSYDIIDMVASARYILDRAATRNADTPEIVGYVTTMQQGLDDYDARWPLMLEAWQNEDWETSDALALETMDQMESLTAEADQIYFGVQPYLEEAHYEAESLAYGTLAVAVVVVIVFAAIAWWAARMLTTQMARPLASLIEATAALEAGTFDPLMVNNLCERRDEIGRIARSLIETASEQAARRDALLAEATELRVKLARQGVGVAEAA
jgi:methyl-accepting chemotaxis protein